MDITQLMANGGIIVILGGILYKINDRRIKKLENGKTDKDVDKILHKHIDEALTELKSTTQNTHDAVIRIETALDIKGD